jgi:hypothetical protein
MFIDDSQLRTLIAQSIVQENAEAHPTDIKMLETVGGKHLEATTNLDFILKQAYTKAGASFIFRAASYAYIGQFKRMRCSIKLLRSIDSLPQRDIEHGEDSLRLCLNHEQTFAGARQVFKLTTSKKSALNNPKISHPCGFPVK